MNIVTVLGFLAHGYATEEFQVTEERLGVYLPVSHPLFHFLIRALNRVLGRTHRSASLSHEHIWSIRLSWPLDNPRGYPDNARQYHPKLRGPVDPRELEIDLRTGMKNYIANETGSWDTSKAHARRTLEKCIWYGRQCPLHLFSSSHTPR